MRIAIATLTADPSGALLLDLRDQGSNLGDTARRLSRVATLDGGASLLDGGYTVADRTLVLDLTGQEKSVVDALKYLCALYPVFNVMTEDGAFRAAPERVNATRMTLLVSGVAEVKN